MQCNLNKGFGNFRFIQCNVYEVIGDWHKRLVILFSLSLLKITTNF